PELLVVGTQYPENLGSPDYAQFDLTFRLSDNSLLQEACLVQHDFRSGLLIKPIHTKTIDCDGSAFRFERHLEFEQGQEAHTSTTVRSFLTANTKVDTAQDVYSTVDGVLLPRLWDVLHLASFAARERTRVYRWSAITASEHVSVYLGNVAPIRLQDDQSSIDTLIDKSDFDEFMRVGLATLRGADLARAELGRSSILRAVRDSSEPAEARYLSLFSALESVLLQYRRQENLEYTVTKSAYKKLRQALEICLADNSDLFPSEFHRLSAVRSIVALKRITISV